MLLAPVASSLLLPVGNCPQCFSASSVQGMNNVGGLWEAGNLDVKNVIKRNTNKCLYSMCVCNVFRYVCVFLYTYVHVCTFFCCWIQYWGDPKKMFAQGPISINDWPALQPHLFRRKDIYMQHLSLLGLVHLLKCTQHGYVSPVWMRP